MPRYNMTEDDMDEAYGETKVTPPSESEKESASTVDEENEASAEILIDKDKLPPGCKPGDSYTFKVVKDFGDEASLALVKEKREKETETEEPMSQEASELEALSEEGE